MSHSSSSTPLFFNSHEDDDGTDESLTKADSMIREIVKQIERLDVLNFLEKDWTDSKYMPDFNNLFEFINTATTTIDHVDSHKNVHPNGVIILKEATVHMLYEKLYHKLIPSLKFLMSPIPRTDNQYGHTPVVVIYLCMAQCIQFCKNYWPFDPKSSFYFKYQQEIDYCQRFDLDVVLHAPICNFSVEELEASFVKIETSLHRLIYAPDLCSYVDALEVRLTDILINVYDDVIHNLTEHRVMIGDTPEDGYVLSQSHEFKLIINFLSIKLDFESALGFYRQTEGLCVDMSNPEENIASLELAKKAYHTMTVTCQELYGDIIPLKFSEKYLRDAITTSDGMLFLKENGVNSRIDSSTLVKQFQSISHWIALTQKARAPIIEYIEQPEKDMLCFKILFNLLMNLILNQASSHLDWIEDVEENFRKMESGTPPNPYFFVSGVTISALDTYATDLLIEESHSKPFFIESFNDACIFYQNKLYIFGAHYLDFFRALVFWTEIIFADFGGTINEAIHLQPLVDILYGVHEDITSFFVQSHDNDSESSSSSSTRSSSKVCALCRGSVFDTTFDDDFLDQEIERRIREDMELNSDSDSLSRNHQRKKNREQSRNAAAAVSSSSSSYENVCIHYRKLNDHVIQGTTVPKVSLTDESSLLFIDSIITDSSSSSSFSSSSSSSSSSSNILPPEHELCTMCNEYFTGIYLDHLKICSKKNLSLSASSSSSSSSSYQRKMECPNCHISFPESEIPLHLKMCLSTGTIPSNFSFQEFQRNKSQLSHLQLFQQEINARKAYSEIAELISQTGPRELNASHVLGNTDEKGFAPSSLSSW